VKRKFCKPGAVFVHCIHRLDRPVSGLALFAKTSKALTRLNELSRKRTILRWYLAEVEGHLAQERAQLEHYLIHGEHQALISTMKHPDAKQSLLTYQVLRTKEHTTIVRIELHTGRYHQIRAQFSAIGHPIVGDIRYKAKGGNGDRICLSCTDLQFTHPTTQEVMALRWPIDELSKIYYE
jgi:23S rRNA pseudouridine1911/1915/1917 synthase